MVISAKKKIEFPLPWPRKAGPNREENMDDKDKEQQMLRFEIENCRKNIEFYRLQIDQTEERLLELEKIKKAYEYY